MKIEGDLSEQWDILALIKNKNLSEEKQDMHNDKTLSLWSHWS